MDEGEHRPENHKSPSWPLVNWSTVCRPARLGGFGVADLEKFGRALRLRWAWLSWTDDTRPWFGARLPCTAVDMSLFRASTTITLGDGRRCLFWHDPWCHGSPLKLRFPNLYEIATRKHRSVAMELELIRHATQEIGRASWRERVSSYV